VKDRDLFRDAEVVFRVIDGLRPAKEQPVAALSFEELE